MFSFLLIWRLDILQPQCPLWLIRAADIQSDMVFYLSVGFFFWMPKSEWGEYIATCHKEALPDDVVDNYSKQFWVPTLVISNFTQLSWRCWRSTSSLKFWVQILQSQVLHSPAEIHKTKVTVLFWSHRNLGNGSPPKCFCLLFPFTNQVDALMGVQLGWDPMSHNPQVTVWRIPVEKHSHQDWCKADSPLFSTITPWCHSHKWQPLICQQWQSGQKGDTEHHVHTSRLWHGSGTGPSLHSVVMHHVFPPAPNHSQRAGILQGRRNESLKGKNSFMENPSN